MLKYMTQNVQLHLTIIFDMQKLKNKHFKVN